MTALRAPVLHDFIHQHEALQVLHRLQGSRLGKRNRGIDLGADFRVDRRGLGGSEQVVVGHPRTQALDRVALLPLFDLARVR